MNSSEILEVVEVLESTYNRIALGIALAKDLTPHFGALKELRPMAVKLRQAYLDAVRKEAGLT